VVSAKVKGKTQGLPCAGPPTVVHVDDGAAVVVIVVVVVGTVGVPHSLVVQVGSPRLLHTQVLQSTLNSSPGVHALEHSSTPLLQKQVPLPDTKVSAESASLHEVLLLLLSAPGQEDGQ